jgi:iron complex outermembrane recepter protein
MERSQETCLVSPVLAALAMLCLPGTGQAQTAEPAAASPGNQVITVTARRNTLLSELPSSVTVLSSQDIQKQLTRDESIFSLLEATVPGLAQTTQLTFFSSGTGTGPLLRGRPATVLINGVPVNTLLRGNGVDLAMIDTNAIGRIEAQRGANATFGFGASGGIIDIQTRRARSSELAVRGVVSSSLSTTEPSGSGVHNAYIGAGRIEASGLDWWAGVAGTSLGKRFGPDGKQLWGFEATIGNVDLNVGYRIDEHSQLRTSLNLFDRRTRRAYYSAFSNFGYSADGSFADGSYVIPDGLDPKLAYADPSDESRRQGQRASVFIATYSHSNVLGGALSVSLLDQRNHLRTAQFLSSGDPPPDTFYYVYENKMRASRTGVRSNLSHDIELADARTLSLTYGLDAMRDQMRRPNKSGGTELATVTVPVLGTIEYERPTAVVNPIAPPVQIDSTAVFGEASYKAGAWTTRAGLRYERYQPKSLGYNEGEFQYAAGSMPDFSSTLPSLGAIYALSPGAQVYAGVSQGVEISELGRALRLLGSPGVPVTRADLARVRLRPAKTTEYEVGYRGQLGTTSVSAAAFYSRAPLSAQIQADPNDRNGPLISVREPQRTWGFEATAKHPLDPRGSTVGAVFAFQEGKRIIEGDDDWTPQPNTRIAPARLTLDADIVLGRGWSTQWQTTYSASRRKYPARVPVGFGYVDDTGPADSYVTVDAGLTWGMRWGELVLGVENLFNRRYIPAGNTQDDLYAFPAEGRRVRLTLSVNR